MAYLSDKTKKVSFTHKELFEIINCVAKQIDWGSGGCYGDGDKITMKTRRNTACRALEKLYKARDLANK